VHYAQKFVQIPKPSSEIKNFKYPLTIPVVGGMIQTRR